MNVECYVRPANPMKQITLFVHTHDEITAWAMDRGMLLATRDFGGFHQCAWPDHCPQGFCPTHKHAIGVACPGRDGWELWTDAAKLTPEHVLGIFTAARLEAERLIALCY